MSEAKTEPLAPQAREKALHVVLFGMPGAGKTSLLGALAQSARSTENPLKGKLEDLSGELAELRRLAYEAEPGRTAEPLVAYAVRYRPDTAEGAGAGTSLDINIYDCDGRVANEIVGRQQRLLDSQDSSLEDAILSADTLILAVDISSPAEVLNRDFQQFVRFLRLLQQSRSQRNDVSGLPVYLVLTKCDLLAKSGETFQSWVDRIDDRKRKVAEEFRSYLARHSQLNQPFGRIRLEVAATALRRPEFEGVPAKPREPYGVAELFRQCFHSARSFRQQRRRAQRKLSLTLAGAVALAGVMLLLSLVFVLSRQGVEAELLEKGVKSFRSRYPAAAPERLESAADYGERLRSLRNNPSFEKLPQDLQQFVNDALTEQEAYRAFHEELKKISAKYGPPAKVTDEESLDSLRKELEALQVPREYVAKWAEVGAVKQKKQWLRDIHDISETLREVKENYRKAIKEARQLEQLKDKLTVSQLQDKARDLLLWARAHARSPETVQGLLLPNSTRITWDSVFGFRSVKSLADEWKEERKKVERMANPF